MHTNRWIIENDSIVWNIPDAKADIHTDNIEISGNKLSVIITYGVGDDGYVTISREIRYPTLRVRPRDTHSTLASWHYEMHSFTVDGKQVREIPYKITYNGLLKIYTRDEDSKISIIRTLFPCRNVQAYIEHAVITNTTTEDVKVVCDEIAEIKYEHGTKGVYPVEVHGNAVDTVLQPGHFAHTDLVFSARINGQPLPTPDAVHEISERMDYVRYITNETTVLESNNEALNLMYNFSKIRCAESIFDTLSGPLHSPGGGKFYAAIWTNDQIEYAAPFFSYLGYDRAIEATDNAFSLYLPLMAEDMVCIPSSIIDEGLDYWSSAGDRGDPAMYLYGVTRFILGTGRRDLAEKFWYAINWCIRFCRSMVNEHGVIRSDSDELEGRFPSGDANLCTSCLTYGGLVSAADVANMLGEHEKAAEFTAFAEELHKNINDFFGTNISGFDAYRYYEENDKLRSWICIPLTMGIFERQEGTIAALLSDKLFGENGLVCVEGDGTYWDRSTLYALRGILNAGRSDDVWEFFKYYIDERLLRDHVPYAIEAYPESDRRHLAAESALFGRIVTEGIFGIVPVGEFSFKLTPSVPTELGNVSLKKLRICGREVDINVVRDGETYHTTVTMLDGVKLEYNTRAGETILVNLG